MRIADHLVTLSLRPGEYVEYHQVRPIRPEGTLYAVMLRSAPPFPGPKQSNCLPLSLLCARLGVDGWVWVHPDAYSKQVICSSLLAHMAGADRWYFMELRRLEQ
jgi:hypothetical protein